jgi:hypothetical protein
MGNSLIVAAPAEQPLEALIKDELRGSVTELVRRLVPELVAEALNGSAAAVASDETAAPPGEIALGRAGERSSSGQLYRNALPEALEYRAVRRDPARRVKPTPGLEPGTPSLRGLCFRSLPSLTGMVMRSCAWPLGLESRVSTGRACSHLSHSL